MHSLEGSGKSACGRKQTLTFGEVELVERPLWVKADTQNLAPKKWLANDRFTPESSRWATLVLKGCL
jgi:hypothetical protein